MAKKDIWDRLSGKDRKFKKINPAVQEAVNEYTSWNELRKLGITKTNKLTKLESPQAIYRRRMN